MSGMSGRKYFYGVGLHLDPAAWAEDDVKSAFAKVAQAHRESSSGIRYATYRSLTGKHPSLHGLIGLRSLEQLENLPKTGETVAAAHGKSANKILANYGRARSHASRVIMKYRPELSNPQDYDEPPPYLYFVEAKIKGEAGSKDVRQAIARLVGAHRGHPSGRGYVTYSKLAGNGRPTLYGFSGLDSLSQLEEWIPQRTILHEVYGESEGDRYLAAYNSYIEIRTTMVLEYQPELSNFPAG